MNKGFQYEKTILSLMKTNGYVSEEFLLQESAGSDSTKPDLVLNLNGKDLNIELKESIKSQAGGTSIRYTNGLFELVKDVEGIDKQDIYDLLCNNKNHFDNMLDFHQANNIPFSTSKKKWTESVEKGLLKKTNFKIDCKSSFIENHYTNKNTYYINIGKKGLYYMKEDIANLGVPRFKANIDLEIRLTRNGSKLNSKGERVCSSSLRVQSRIKKLEKSPFSLENIDSISRFK